MAVFGASADPILIVGRDGKILDLNRVAEQLYGWRRPELLGRPLAVLVSPELQRETEQLLARAARAERIAGIDGERIRKDGEKVAVLSSFGPMVDEVGEVVGIVLVERDVAALKALREALHDARGELDERGSELVKTQLELRQEIIAYNRLAESNMEEREQHRAILEAIEGAVLVLDPDGGARYLNPAAERLTGWTAGEARGKPVTDLLHLFDERTGKPVRDAMARFLATAGEVVPKRELLVTRDGKTVEVDDAVGAIRDSGGNITGLVMTLRAAASRPEEVPAGLVDRTRFDWRLSNALRRNRELNARFSLCHIAVDGFEQVVEAVGAEAGEALLWRVAGVLREQVRDRDTLVRLDERYGLLLEHCALDEAIELAQGLVADFRGYEFFWERRTFHLSLSTGVAEVMAGLDVPALHDRARVACLAAQRAGGDRVHVYSMRDGIPVERFRATFSGSELRQAVSRQQFQLYGQPIVPLGVGALPRRVEVLLRLAADGQLFSPESFMPKAERAGLMPAIDRWVIGTALEQYAASAHRGQLELSINVSGQSLPDEELPAYIDAQLLKNGVPADHLCFEVSEQSLEQYPEAAQQFIAAVKGRGCRVALDNFGNHLTLVEHLKRFAIDYLKIDGHLVQHMAEDSLDEALVAAINQVGHAMPLKTIGQHAANDAVIAQLRTAGVDFAQGFGVGSPVPLTEALG